MAMYVFARGEVTFLGLSRHDPDDPMIDRFTPGVPAEVVAAARARMTEDPKESMGYVGDWWYHGFRLDPDTAAAMLLGTRGESRKDVLDSLKEAIWAVERVAARIMALLPPDADDSRRNDLLDLEMA